MYYLVKVILSAIIIVIITEVGKSNAVLGGIIKSLPLISILSFVWLYLETHNIQTVSTVSLSTFWFVLPTLPLFLIFPYFLKLNFNFYLSLSVSLIIMLALYGVMMMGLNYFKFFFE